MFGIDFETWNSTCNMYFSLNEGSLSAYLQWYPFSKLSSDDKELIKSETFFNTYIKTGAFLLYDTIVHQSENFLQKGDGSFRDSSLVSPIFYLVLQAIGKEISKHYSEIRNFNQSVYYAGDYLEMHPKYKRGYDSFFKEVNEYASEYEYFIKTDITNFFANINVDKLISQIDKICNSTSVVFSQNRLQLFRELFLFCGNGRFPLLENSIASSFLSTIVYLDEIDAQLYEFISSKIENIENFKMIRYVDDMYIFISSKKPIGYLHEAYNEIRNEYSSILKDYGLSLNAKKCCFKESKEINEELKKSLYDEFFKGKKLQIEDMFNDSLLNFLRSLSIELLLDSIDVEKYNELINEHFSSSDIEFTPSEVFNYYVYENDSLMKDALIINEIIELVEQSISFISLDPKRLTVMIMKTENSKAIKAFLNQLFKRYKADKWNSYDTNIAISYLTQSKFKHIDILSIFKEKEPLLYRYYELYCKNSFVCLFKDKTTACLNPFVSNDYKSMYLFFMHKCEHKRSNYMASFAYFKNFFDRITANLDFKYVSTTLKKPNYKGFYKENAFINFYRGIPSSESVIKNAHSLRNSNPLAHSSLELIDKNNSSQELNKSITELYSLILSFIKSKES